MNDRVEVVICGLELQDREVLGHWEGLGEWDKIHCKKCDQVTLASITF